MMKNKPDIPAVIVALTLTNVPFRTGQVNGSGISKYVYFIQSRYILHWPDIAENLQDGNAPEGYVGYDGDFEIDPDAKWIRIYNTQGEGEVTSTPVGDPDSKLYNNKLSYRFPKMTPQALVLANAAVNGDGVFIAWHDGAYRVIGHRHYRTVIDPNAATGNAAGSSKGITFEASCHDHKAMPVYRGLVLLEDGVLDCETDTFYNYSDMEKTNYHKTYQVEGGDTIRFDALSQEGRMHLEGTGDIHVQVSVTGEEGTFTEIEHDLAFENGKLTAPFRFIIGDHVIITATTLTKAEFNYNNVNRSERV